MTRLNSFNTEEYNGFSGGAKWVVQVPGRTLATAMQPVWEQKAFSEGYGQTMGQHAAHEEIQSVIRDEFVILNPSSGLPEVQSIQEIPELIEKGVLKPHSRVYFSGMSGYSMPASAALPKFLGWDYFNNPLPKEGKKDDKKAVAAPSSSLEKSIEMLAQLMVQQQLNAAAPKVEVNVQEQQAPAPQPEPAPAPSAPAPDKLDRLEALLLKMADENAMLKSQIESQGKALGSLMTGVPVTKP